MTRDDIIRMAEAASILGKYDDLAGAEWRQDTIQELERFAALVAAAEREACADICDQHASVEGIAQRCADAIRARSKE
jgi:hypothetical protein